MLDLVPQGIGVNISKVPSFEKLSAGEEIFIDTMMVINHSLTPLCILVMGYRWCLESNA